MSITFMNGGRTLAWSFHAISRIVVDYRPESQHYWWLHRQLGDLGDTFIPPGKEKTVQYVRTDFRLTEEQKTAMQKASGQKRLYVAGTAHYRNMKGDKLWYEFCGVY